MLLKIPVNILLKRSAGPGYPAQGLFTMWRTPLVPPIGSLLMIHTDKRKCWLPVLTHLYSSHGTVDHTEPKNEHENLLWRAIVLDGKGLTEENVKDIEANSGWDGFDQWRKLFIPNEWGY